MSAAPYLYDLSCTRVTHDVLQQRVKIVATDASSDFRVHKIYICIIHSERITLIYYSRVNPRNPNSCGGRDAEFPLASTMTRNNVTILLFKSFTDGIKIGIFVLSRLKTVANVCE